MDVPCPTCRAPVVEGFAFCGNCGALVHPGPDRDDPPAPPQTTPGEVTAAPEPPPTDEPGHLPRPRPARGWILGALVIGLAVALIVLGAPSPDTEALAPPPAPGGGRFVEVDVPSLAGEVSWTVAGASTTDVQGPFPWAAPALTDEHVAVVVPGAVLFHDRDAATSTRSRVLVPTSARTGAAVLDDRRSRLVVVGDDSAWAVEPDGVVARSTSDDIADVSPLALGPSAVLVEGELGNLRRLVLDGHDLVEAQDLRGVELAQDEGIPRFHLAVRASDRDGVWVGARDRSDGNWSVWRLDRETLAVLGRIDLGSASTPTVAAAGGGALVVVVDEVVTVHEADGTVRWREMPGPGAEALGVEPGEPGGGHGLLLVRHDLGRVVYDLGAGREVARATLGLFGGARGEAAAGEVLAFDGATLVALRIRDATVARRLDGRALSIGGHDAQTLAWVAAGERGQALLRLLPTPDRGPLPPGRADARELELAVPGRCAIVGVGGRIVWHDGRQLREVDVVDGDVTASSPASSTAGSTIAASDQEVLLVDGRGVVRTFGPGLVPRDVLAIGDDPIGGAAPSADLVVAAGGTGRTATLSSTAGYVRGIGPDGSSRWLVRTRESVVSPPVARGETAAIRQEDGAVVLVRDGLLVADVPSSDRRAAEPPVLDARGALVRDGHDVVALFPQGEEAWRVRGVAASPGLSSDGDVVIARSGRDVLALDRATGAERWRTTLDAEGIGVPVLTPGRVVVALHDAVVVLDRSTGRELSRAVDLPTLEGSIVPTSSGVVACTADGRLAMVR